MRKACVSEKEE